MRSMVKVLVLRLCFLLCCSVMLCGCGMFEFNPRMDLGSNWVSKDGKSGEQLQEDQRECKREVMIMNPQFSGQGGMGGGWDMNDVKAFNNCMRARGWTKE
jgi:hypothetical protein